MIDDVTARVLRRVSDLHAVYRMFDAEGTLLYIGMTAQPGRRIEQHCEKRWFPQVATISLEWYPHMSAARLAEKEAIEWEWPRHNLAGVRRRSPRRQARVPVVPPKPRHPAPRPSQPLPAAALVPAPREAPPDDPDRLIGLREAAPILKCSIDALRKASQRPGFPAAVVPGRAGVPKQYTASDLVSWRAAKARAR